MPGALSGQQFAAITNDWVEVGPPKEPHPDAGTKLAGATQLAHTREHLPAGEGITAYVVGVKSPHEWHRAGPATAADADAHLARMMADPKVQAEPMATRGSWHQQKGVSQSVPEGGYPDRHTRANEKVVYDQGRLFRYRTDVHPDHPQSRESVLHHAMKFGQAQQQDAIFGLEDFEEPNVHAFTRLEGRVSGALSGRGPGAQLLNPRQVGAEHVFGRLD